MSEETENTFKRPQFGKRFLPQDDDDSTVFKHNAW